jgi:hypothetical protein
LNVKTFVETSGSLFRHSATKADRDVETPPEIFRDIVFFPPKTRESRTAQERPGRCEVFLALFRFRVILSLRNPKLFRTTIRVNKISLSTNASKSKFVPFADLAAIAFAASRFRLPFVSHSCFFLSDAFPHSSLTFGS